MATTNKGENEWAVKYFMVLGFFPISNNTYFLFIYLGNTIAKLHQAHILIGRLDISNGVDILQTGAVNN